MQDVVLVNMPLAAVERPSIALGLLQVLLRQAGLEVEVLYPNLRFLEYAGLDDYLMLDASPIEEALADWLFAPVAFDARPDDEASFLAGYGERAKRYGHDARAELPRLRRLREGVPAFVDAVVEAVLAREPRIVGCTSTFQQHVASLALLRRIRKRAPEVITLMGGANCESVMGRVTHRRFPWIDYIVSGEADTLLPGLCRDLLARGREIPAEDLPFGVLGPAHRRVGYPMTTAGDGVPRATGGAMNALPLPDYADYFAELRRSPFADRIVPGLPMEFSRGCWWGERSHCTFCGLNGGSLRYRAKPAAQAAAEMLEMSARYGTRRIEAVDNILATEYLTEALAPLAALPQPLAIFFEVRANLKRDEVQRLAASGVRWLQPGIESLDTRVLKLMGKGTTAAQNVQLLKWCRQFGVRLSWNLLWGFPGEDDAWYGEMATWLAALQHLQPGGLVRLRYQRYSPYAVTPARWGLDLRPYPSFRDVYPLATEDLHELVYYFEDAAAIDGGVPASPRASARPGLTALRRAMRQWYRGWETATLMMRHEGDVLVVRDTRALAVTPEHRFEGVSRAVLIAADEGMSEARLRDRLGVDGWAPDEVDAAIKAVAEAHLLLRLDGRIVGLALCDPTHPVPAVDEFPGGAIRHEARALLDAR